MKSTAVLGPRTKLSVSALQCEIRALFADAPTHQALAKALGRIGEYLRADYAVIHCRLGVQMLSEEWVSKAWNAEEPEIEGPLRDSVNAVMWEAMSAGSSKCARLRGHTKSVAAVMAAVIYDEDLEEAGSAAIVILDSDRETALNLLSWFEGIVGFLGLLLTGSGKPNTSAKADGQERIKPIEFAEHPVRLALNMVSQLKNRHGLDMAAIGFVNGNRVRVTAISGLEEVRPSNPGVKLVQAAMEECLDHAAPIAFEGMVAVEESGDDCRLHAQWSAALGGVPVGSIPLIASGDIVAVLSVRDHLSGRMHEGTLQKLGSEMEEYGALVPLSRAASRGLLTHAGDVLSVWYRRIVGHGRRRSRIVKVAMAFMLLWLLFGSLPYSFTVPCEVRATNQRVISCPREGTLQDLFVQPGDAVRQGQLLATLDANDDLLQRSKLQAEIAALEAQGDKALAEGEAGQGRIIEAQQRSIRAQLAAVELSIAQAEIRAPQEGIILSGDLRSRLGGRLALGDSMFKLARCDRMLVVLRIPETLLLDARESVATSFAPAARPDEEVELNELRIDPSSTVVDGKNVFFAETTAAVSLDRLAPGMEGVAYIQVPWRSAWWVLTHRVTDWMRLHFWY